MDKYDEVNIDELIKPIDIPGISKAVAQFSTIYDSTMMKEMKELMSNPIITETQKVLSRYGEMVKPLQIEGLSVLRKAIKAQNKWMKQYDFSGYRSFAERLSEIMGTKSYNINGITKTLDEMMRPLKNIADSSRMNEIFASMSGLSTILQSAGNISFVSQMLNNNITLAELSQKSLKDININLLGRVTDQVLAESEEWDFDVASETIVEKYEKATDFATNDETQSNLISEKHKIDIKEVREWLNFIISVLSFIMGIASSTASTTINNYNYAQQVNNYYIVGMGYDAKELNTINYRIVNRESVVRMKHDCHSSIIGRVDAGEIVRILKKYKKWRRIVWEDEEGEECIGWIQNYKLTEFKKPRTK